MAVIFVDELLPLSRCKILFNIGDLVEDLRFVFCSVTLLLEGLPANPGFDGTFGHFELVGSALVQQIVRLF